MPLHVLNPGGRDPFQDFRTGLPAPGEGHAPVNFHAWAAAGGGVFARALEELPDDASPVLVLLRRRLERAAAAVEALRGRGRAVWVSWKETGRHQVAAQLRHWGNAARLRRLLGRVDGALCPVEWIGGHYRAFGGPGLRCELAPTPYPIGEAGWDFSGPWAQRRGILIGTREFGVPSRHHAEALLAARLLQQASGEPITVVNGEGAAGRREFLRHPLAGLGESELNWIEGPLPYPDWLRLMAAHKLVWQLDDSGVPGQVAGDSLLAGTPCLGGQGQLDRMLSRSWRGLLSAGYRQATPFTLAKALLGQGEEAGTHLLALWREAGEELGFPAFRLRLEALDLGRAR